METKTITFFKEISKIPRRSGNEEKIADYIVSFAKERNLEYLKDKYNNVIVKKYLSNSKPIILQAHLDMVCEKDINKDIDFAKDPIEVIEKDGYLMANGTTLGADNGIGVAQILNILDNVDRSVEAIFTTDEEVSMNGAEKIDLSSLKGTTMINLDGFDADTILIESASFTDIDIKLHYQCEEEANNLYEINLSGLLGGHSGFKIKDIKSNSLQFLARLLLNIKDIRIHDFVGGTEKNVIPSSAKAIIDSNEDINKYINDYLKDLKKEYPNLNISFSKIDGKELVLSNEQSKLFLNSLIDFKHGVFNLNQRDEVTTSENIGCINLKNNLMQIGLRSSVEKEREKVVDYLKNLSQKYHYDFIITGYQPGFRTLESSNLVKDLISVYKKINKKEPILKSVHIGVEVGLLKEKIKGLEAVIISPKIIGAHSPSEKVEIASIKMCDEWLINYLLHY